MLCATCHNSIPDNLVACPACAIRRNDAAVLAAQGEYLARVRQGHCELVTYLDANGKRHLLMFNTDKGFCGTPLTLSRQRRGTVQLDDDDTMNRICSGCRIEMKRLMEGVPA